jgi:PAS domain S-box-containing protein
MASTPQHLAPIGRSPIPGRIALYYAIAGVIWILFSDRIVGLITPTTDLTTTVQTYKGWGFVAVTALLLYVALRKQVHQLEARTRAANELYALLFHRSPIPTMIVRTRDLCYIDANPAFESAVGYTRAEIIGHTAADLKLWVQPAQHEQQLQILRDHGHVSGFEFEYRTKQGATHTGLCSIELLERDGEEYLISSVVDISARKRAEATLHYQAQLLENVSDAIISTDLSYRIQSWNHAAEVLYGLRAADVEGRELTEVVPFDLPDAQLMELVVTQLMSEGRWNGELIQTRHDGTKIHISSSVSLIQGSDGTATGIVAVGRDVTRHHHAEELLRQRLAELEALHTITVALRNAQSREAALPTLLDQILAMLGTDAGAIWLYDPDSEVLRSAVARGWFLQLDSAPIQPTEGIAGLVFSTGQARRSREFVADAQARTTTIDRVPAGWGGICAPIRAGTVTVGVLYVALQLPREISAEQEQLLASVAELAGASIHRMQLYEETVRRLNQLQALHAIDRAITASLDLRMTLTVLLEHVTRQLQTDAASVLLLSPHLHMLEYAAGHGFHTRSIQRLRVRLGESMAGRAALERRTIHVAGAEALQGEHLRPGLFDAEGFVSYFGVPLIAKGEVKGVLEVFHRAPFRPNPGWVEFLETLSEQAAIAIDSAQLFDSLQRTNIELTMAYDATIEGWVRALDLRDKETEGHSLRVTEMTVRLASQLRIDDADLLHLRRGALLHDVGKLGIPDAILLKPGKLTTEEWEVMRMHPQYAYEMLSPIAYLRPALDIPLYHHEKWDGTGYPHGLQGDHIPLPARIFAVVDVWDALRSDRPYRASWPIEQVIEHIRALAGSHFDPRVVEVFLQHVDRL